MNKVVDVFGFRIDELYNLDIDNFTEKDIQNRIEKYRRSNKSNQISAADLKHHFEKFKGKTYFINELSMEYAIKMVF